MATSLPENKPKYSGKYKTSLILGLLVTIIAANYLVGKYYETSRELEIEVFPKLLEGYEHWGITETNISMLIATGLIVVSVLIIRFFIFPHFTDVPGRVQSLLELVIGELKEYAFSVSDFREDYIPAYGLTVGTVIIYSGAVELLGFRAPTTDFLLTASLAIIALIIINLAGIQRFGYIGRIKSFFRPVPMVGPILIVTNLLIPVSLTFRLFGNILGGMIVLELVYAVTPIIIPGILNSFFVLFHAGMQTYVFLTLMFSYVNEAVEDSVED